MQIYVTDDRLGGYFRRYQLALRMMAHGARTQTVVTWSGLTRDQLVTQRRRWGFAPENRQRGPAPTAFHVFFRSRRHRSEAALFASLCHITGAINARLDRAATRLSPNLENGELFCDALEVFHEWRPGTDLDFEHAMQLAAGVVHAEHVTLGWCSDCRGTTLIEGGRRNYANCGHCGPDPQLSGSARKQGEQDLIHYNKKAKSERNPDRLPEGEGGTSGRDLVDERHEDSEDHQSGPDGLDDRRKESESSE